MKSKPLTPSDILVGLALEAPSREAFRSEALEHVVRWVGASGGCIQRLSAPIPPVETGTYHEVDMDYVTLATERWDELYAVELAPIARASMESREAVLDTRIFSAQQRRRMALYSDVMGPSGAREVMYCMLGLGNDESAVLSLLNMSAVKRFTDRSLSTATSLLPVLSLAEGFLDRQSRTIAGELPIADLRLSPRLRQVFEQLLTGASEKQIAERIGLTVHTLHEYVQRIYRAAGVRSRPELMARALRLRPR